jgi:DNA-binding IclR family transcriptional regulator
MAKSAGLPAEAEIQRCLLRPLEHSTEHTTTDPVRLREELAAIRREGCAWVLEELEIGLIGASAPVFTGGQKVVAWVNFSSSSYRFPVEKRPKFAALTMQAAREITDRLGGSGRF